MGWIDDLVNTMTKAKTAVNDAVQPTVDTIHNSPLASFLKGNVNEGFSKIGNDLSNQGKTIMSGAQAGVKQMQGQTLTPQDLANQQAGQKMLMGGVLGTVGGMGAAPEAEAGNIGSHVAQPEMQPKPVRVSGGDTLPPVGKVAPEQLNKVRVPSNVYGGETDARIQQTLQNDVPGNSVQEKYANLGPTMKNMGDQINQGLANNPKTVSIGDMDNYIVNNAKSWLRTQDMTPEQAISSMSTYTKQLYKDIAPGPQQNPVGVAGSYVPESGGSATMKGPLNISTPPPQYAYDNQAHTFIPNNMPQPGKFAESVSTADINKMRLLNNQDYGAVYQKMQNGSPLTTRDISIKLAHDTFKDILGDLHPDLAEIVGKQSDLFTLGNEAKLGNLAAKEGLPVKPPSFPSKVLKIGGGIGAAGVGIAGGAPIIENIGGTALGLAKTGLGDFANLFKNENTTNAEGKGKDVSTHNDSSIPHDNNGHYTLPPNPGITPLVPGTPSYTRANNALPGNSRQFMVNAPQYMASANTIQDDIKNGMPLDLMTKFKSSQDVQAYLSNPSNPYAKQLANIADLDAKFKSAYTQVNGVSPDENQFINPSDSKEQFQEKYNEMVSFIYNNYAQFQAPYLQTTEAPASLQVQNPGAVQGSVKYSSPPPSNDASAIVGGSLPPFDQQFPGQTNPGLQ